MTSHRIVVMGVSGSGKSTIGELLARRLAVPFIDADSLHPPENVAKMSSGVALTDADRGPWLRRIADELATASDLVVACSALKRSYRDVLRTAGGVTFVYLSVTHDVVAERVSSRGGHFMKANMIDSQFQTLQPPSADEHDVVVVDATSSVEQVVDEIAAAVTR
jgi:carbohydrate kinase (thermoresistant glucokinase family)